MTCPARRHGRRVARLAAPLVAALVACSQPPEPGSSTRTPARGDPAAQQPSETPAEPTGRVANYDPRGVEHQPDYDGEAAALRDRIAWRMPKQIPSDSKKACAAMFGEVDAFYREVEREPAPRERALKTLQDTRAEDLEACVGGTSPAAATCVTVLLADRDTEFPWLLDQCMRAFPKGR